MCLPDGIDPAAPPSSTCMSKRTPLIALAATALGLSAAGPAAAQAPDPDDFKLRQTQLDLRSRVDALAGQLVESDVGQVLGEANRPMVENGPCNQDAFPGIPAGSRWFCFDPADSGDGQGQLEWVPQGVSTAADAGAGGEALLVSWYDGADAPEKGVRVSFHNPATGKYRHVLLAYPYIADGGRPTYEIVGRPQGGIHAGGILWYGNHLYVVDTTRGVRVFDTRFIFDLESSPNGDTSDKTRIGWAAGAYRGFGYRYVMPQVDAWVNAAGPDADPGDRCAGTGAPKFSYLSVDRSEEPHRMITGEFCRDGDVGRVARWPLDAGTGLPVVAPDGLVHASEAYRLAADQIQGAVSVGGSWYLSRSKGRDEGGELIVARPNAGTLRATETRPAGVGPEDLSFADGRLWTVTEFAGRRMLYGVPR
jgi:hypothetical protein